MGVGDDSLSIHASDADDGHLISEVDGGEKTTQFVASQFAVFSQDIAIPVEEKAPTLPAKVQALLKSIQRPSNVDMKVKPTNKEIFTIRHGAMPSLRKADCSLQNVQTILVKSSYSMMKHDKFLTVLPHNMKSLAERPKGSHAQLFGDITERQIEARGGGFPHAETPETPPVWLVCRPK